MKKIVIVLLTLILAIASLGVATCAFALTIDGAVYGDQLVWEVRTTPTQAFQNYYSCADHGNDWTCDPGLINPVETTCDKASTSVSISPESDTGLLDLLTAEVNNIYPGYFNQLHTIVYNAGTECLVMPRPVLNWMDNTQTLSDGKVYLLLADGQVILNTEPLPDNAMVEICWLNNTGLVMEPGDKFQEAFRFHILSTNIEPPGANPSISLVKEANVTEAGVGDEIIYMYSVTNTGDVPLTSVQLVDDKLGSISLDKTELAPNESATGTARHTVQESDLPGPLLNVATASGEHSGIPVEPVSEDATVDLLIPWKDLVGLTPGYWKNWRNHYNTEELNNLLAGTIAADINSVDMIFKNYSAKPGMELTILRAHLLATQLTLNLTKNPFLPNPDGAFLIENGQVEWGQTITINDAVERAHDILEYPGNYTRGEILDVKDLLDFINNLE